MSHAAAAFQTLQGRLDLSFAHHRGKTRMMSCYQLPPLKASRALYPDDDGAATVYLVDTSGGIASGDKNRMTISASAAAKVHLIQQSSTKIYPARLDGEVSKQSLSFDISEESSLYWHPETTIPFAGSRFVQTIEIALDSSSTCYFAEILSPGRLEHAESFQYESLDLKLSVAYEGRQIAYDRLRFQPDATPQLGMLDDYYYGSAWFFSPDFGESAAELQEACPIDQDCRFAVTSLDPVGFHARWLSRDLCLLKAHMKSFFQHISTS
ncbi:urease accessory protein UreD [Halalkalibacter oceani]|uniref:urease accessory protein UreD n=1 Tax=Halalkalibacter oceani TaxID=1653776 RepID=UPI00339B2953